MTFSFLGCVEVAVFEEASSGGDGSPGFAPIIKPSLSQIEKSNFVLSYCWAVCVGRGVALPKNISLYILCWPTLYLWRATHLTFPE